MLQLSKRSRIAKVLTTIFVLSFVALTLPIATPAKPLDKVTVRMCWYWAGYVCPFFLAKERGYFEENGIDVEILEGRGSAIACQLVGNKSNDFGMADAGTVYQAAAKGVPIMTVGIERQDGGLGVCFLKGTNIKTAKDLEGKTIAATADGSPYKLFPAVIDKNNLDESKIKIVIVDAAAKLVALMQRKVDALLGGIDDQPVIIRSKGYDAEFILYSQMGVVILGKAILAHRDTIANNPDLVRRFVAATIKGILETEKDPDAAVDIFMKAHPERKRTVIDKGLKGYLKILKVRRPARYGYGDPKDVTTTVEILKIETDKTWIDFHTNEFIP